jgi:hypothetical protein
MSESTTAMTSSTSVYTTRRFWERLWRTAGLQFVVFFISQSSLYLAEEASMSQSIRPKTRTVDGPITCRRFADQILTAFEGNIV